MGRPYWSSPRPVVGGKKEKNKGNKERYLLQEAGLIPVSVWRTIFVANEWVKLQDVRAISMEITLIGLLFLMRGLEMEDYARLIPAGMGEVGMPFHTLLRFALSSSLLLSICLVQWLFRWALWERYVKIASGSLSIYSRSRMSRAYCWRSATLVSIYTADRCTTTRMRTWPN